MKRLFLFIFLIFLFIFTSCSNKENIIVNQKPIIVEVKSLYLEKTDSSISYIEAELNFNLSSKDLDQTKELFKKAKSGAREEDISSLLSQYQLLLLQHYLFCQEKLVNL